MEIKRSLKSKLKKLMFMLPILLVVFSLLCIPVSAVSTDETSTLGGVTVQGASFYRLFGSWGSSGSSISVSNNGVSLQVSTTDPDGWGANAGAYFKFEYLLYFENLSPSDTSNISFDVVLYSFNGDNTVNSVTTQHSYIRNFNESVSGGVSQVSNSQLFYSINSFTGNTLKVATVFNQSSGTAYIYRIEIQNINVDTVGTQDIINNQNQNTDEILNGWQSSGSVDGGDNDMLADAESGLINDNQGAAENEISNVNDNVFGSIQRLASSFGAAGSLFRQLTVRVPDFNVFIYFSLAIGVVPLIVGMGINGLRASDRRSSRDRIQSAYRQGYNSGYTSGKGG